MASKAFILSLLSLPITLGQTLNSWPVGSRAPIPIGCSANHTGDSALDFNTATYCELAVPGTLELLFNFPAILSGLYIQSSDVGMLVDYYVETVSYSSGQIIAGNITGATSNFTYIPFTDADGNSQVSSDILQIVVTKSKNGTARINEVYPVYPGDTPYYPPGETSSSALPQYTSTGTAITYDNSYTCTTISSETDTIPFPLTTDISVLTAPPASTTLTSTFGTGRWFYTTTAPTTVTKTTTSTVTVFTPATATTNLGTTVTPSTVTTCTYTYKTTATAYSGTYSPYISSSSESLPVSVDCTRIYTPTTVVYYYVATVTYHFTVTAATATVFSTVTSTTTLPDPSSTGSIVTISTDKTVTSTVSTTCGTATATTTYNIACAPTNIMNNLIVPSYTNSGPGPYAEASYGSASTAETCCQLCLDDPTCAASKLTYEDSTFDYGSCLLYISNTTDIGDGTCGYAFDYTYDPTLVDRTVGVQLGCGELYAL